MSVAFGDGMAADESAVLGEDVSHADGVVTDDNGPETPPPPP